MAESDLDYAFVTGRFGITVADTDDVGDNPDTTWCTQGSVKITPLITSTKVPGATPAKATLGHSTIVATIDSEGYLTHAGKRFVKVVDLTSEKVNPRIAAGKATHRIEFSGVKADNVPVTIGSDNVRITMLGSDGAGSNDLTDLLPVPTASPTPIYRGETGPPGPPGPGASDEDVAGYVADPGSATRAGLSAALVPHRATPPVDPVAVPVYVDTSVEPPQVLGWDGTEFTPIGGGGGTVEGYEGVPNPDTPEGSAGDPGTYAFGNHSHEKSNLYDGHGIDDLNVVTASGSTETLPDPADQQTSYIRLTAAAVALTLPDADAGKRLRLVLAQDGTGGRTPTFPANVGWPGGAAPNWSTGADLVDVADFICVDGLNWICVSTSLGIALPPPPLDVLQQVNIAAPAVGQLTFPSNLGAGNAVLAIMAGGQNTSPTPTGGGLTWTKVGNLGTVPAASETGKAEVWLGTGSTGGPGTATLTFPETGVKLGTFFEIKGATLVPGSVQTDSGMADNSAPAQPDALIATAAGQMPWVIINAEFRIGSGPSAPWVAGRVHNVNGELEGDAYPTGGPSEKFQYAYQTNTVDGATYQAGWLSLFSNALAWQSISFLLR